MKISTSGLRITLALTGVLSAALIAAAAPAGAQPVGLPVGSTCAVAPDSGLSFASARGLAREPAMTQKMKEVPAGAKLKDHSRFSASIPVYFHVITNGGKGQVSDTTINQQMRVLKQAYEGDLGGVNTGLHFRLAGVDHTNNSAWYLAGPGDLAERQMKKAAAHRRTRDAERVHDRHAAEVGSAGLGDVPVVVRRAAADTTASCSTTARCRVARTAPRTRWAGR